MNDTGPGNRDGNRDAQPQRFAVSPINGARIPLGAHPQNTGGVAGRSGAPPSKVRDACRKAFAQRVPLLKRIADGKVADATVTDRLRALDVLARYGLDSRTQGVDISDVRERVARTLEVIREVLPPDAARDLVERIRPHWRQGT